MSLRARLLVLMLLTAVALTAAGALIVEALQGTASVRAAAAEIQAAALVGSLAQGIPPRSPDREVLRARVSAVVAGTREVDAGYCRSSGVLVSGGTNPEGRNHPPAHPIPPDLRDVLDRECTSPGRGRNVSRVQHPHDLVVLSVQPAAADLLAFAIVRAPQAAASEHPSYPLVGLLLAATLGLAGVALEALVVLRRGSDEVQSVLSAFPGTVPPGSPRPRARELSRIVEQLDSMARRLEDSRDRERQLGQTLAHGQRLASLGRMAAGVAHEIRNPLGAIKLRLDLLTRMTEVTPRMREDLEVCQGEILRLNRVVQTLLEVSRKDLVQARSFDLRGLVSARIALGGATGVDVRGEATARGDEDASGRILDNLLRNAVEAAGAGPIVVVLSELEKTVRVSVEDAGPGIPPERLPELFEPFFTLRSGGTGLGLWLSRSLAEAQGGTLLHERVGTVTRFTLELPRGESR